MKRKRILELLGRHYVLNEKTTEIHDVKNLHQNCKFSIMTNGRYVSKRHADNIIEKDHHNKCRWCMS